MTARHASNSDTRTRVVQNRVHLGLWTIVAGAISTGILLAQTILSGDSGLGMATMGLVLATLATLPLLGIATHSHAR